MMRCIVVSLLLGAAVGAKGHSMHSSLVRAVAIEAGGEVRAVRSRSRESFANVSDRVAGSPKPIALDDSLKSCAIVGGGDSLAGMGRGAEIDKHDFVVRVNRLPTKPFYEDFGNKTNVLFALGQRHIHRRGRIALMTPGGKLITKKCNMPRPNKTDPKCNFDALMLWSFTSNGTTHSNLRRMSKRWPLADVPVGFPKIKVREAAQLLLQANGLQEELQPTSGFMAIATFAPVCESVSLYGFSSKGNDKKSADGHPIEMDRHNYDLEHQVTARIISGEMSMDRRWKKKIPHAPLRWIETHLTNVGVVDIRKVM